MEVNRKLDCKNLNCPEPVINLKLAMMEMSSGERLEMQATDPGSCNDVPAWSERTGNPLLETKEKDGVYYYYVQKK